MDELTPQQTTLMRQTPMKPVHMRRMRVAVSPLQAADAAHLEGPQTGTPPERCPALRRALRVVSCATALAPQRCMVSLSLLHSMRLLGSRQGLRQGQLESYKFLQQALTAHLWCCVLRSVELADSPTPAPPATCLPYKAVAEMTVALLLNATCRQDGRCASAPHCWV